MTTVGLVGCGNWGKNILRDLVALNCRVLVADIDPSARDRAIRDGARSVFVSAGTLPECDGYVVAVPIPQLAEVSTFLLSRGRPVFSEKTLCLSLDDADRLASAGGNERLFAMHKWRYHPGIEQLRLIASSGRIGRLEEIRLTRHAWVPDLHGGDVFWTLAVHDLTIVKHLLGANPPPSKVWTRFEGEVPVSLLAVMEGAAVRVTLSTCARHCVRQSAVSMHGSQGSAALPNAYAPCVVIQHRDQREEMAVDPTFPLFLELKEFVEHIQGGPAPRCTLAEAREMTVALLALRQAAGL